MKMVSLQNKRCRLWIVSAIIVVVYFILYKSDVFELSKRTLRQFQADRLEENANAGHSRRIYEGQAARVHQSNTHVPQRPYEKHAQARPHLVKANTGTGLSQETYEKQGKQVPHPQERLYLGLQHLPHGNINAGFPPRANEKQLQPPHDLEHANGVAYSEGEYQGKPKQRYFQQKTNEYPAAKNLMQPQPLLSLTQTNNNMAYPQGIYDGHIQPQQRTSATKDRQSQEPITEAGTGVSRSQGTNQGQPQHWQLQQKTLENQQLAVPHQTQTKLSTEYHQEQTHHGPDPSQGNVRTGQQNPDPRVIVFPVFSLLTDPAVDNSNYRDPGRVWDRMLDFVESVNYSLCHPYVAEVHMMYTQDAMPGYITQRLGNHPKLKFDRVKSTYMWADVIEYIHENYRNRLVLLTNGDVYPGEGLELLNYTKMSEKRLFYSPTRHGRQEKRCRMGPEFCDKGNYYPGSHDTYIFIPQEKFPSEGRRLMRGIKFDTYGSENVALYIYNNVLKYKVLNPCPVIFMYHNHCSYLRHTDRIRIMPVSFMVDPSRDLE